MGWGPTPLAVNGVAYTKAIFGSLSTLACLTVLAVSYAHGKDRRSLRARIVAGLFVSNLTFSVGMAGAIVVHVCKDGQHTQILSTDEHIILTALVYSGKWWMMAYELFIVATSAVTLRSGTVNLPLHRETFGHTLCFVVGLTVFLVFVLKAGPLYRASLDPTGPEARDNSVTYTDLEKDLMDGWVALFVLFMMLWVGLRLQLRNLNREWDAVAAETKEEWRHENQWIEPDTAVHDARNRTHRLMDLQKQSYEEVVLPLAPYVWTFLAFSIPAIVLATEYCAAQAERVHQAKSGPTLGCYEGCYMVLALRPLATAAVYFWDPQCRAELRDYRTLGRKLWHRLSGLAAWTCGRDDRRRGLRFNHELDEVRIIDDDNGTGSDSEHEAVGHGAMSGTRTSVRYELMED